MRKKYNIIWTRQFKKDYKVAMKRHFRIALLDEIVRLLANGQILPEKNKNHALT